MGRRKNVWSKYWVQTKWIISPTAASISYEMMEGTAVDLIKIITRQELDYNYRTMGTYNVDVVSRYNIFRI